MEAGKTVKEECKDNNLLELIAADDEFPMGLEELEESMQPEKYVGRAPRQVEKYLAEVIQPILDENADLLGVTAEINV
jgi:adenylosuccinate lyase